MDILELIADEAVNSDMRINPLKSTVLSTSFLKENPSLSCSISPEMS